jgi:prokaryotic ubiquitin-like protein Pup
MSIAWRGGESPVAEQRRKETKPSDAQDQVDVHPARPELARMGDKIKGQLDEVLDDIDEVLEENASEFVTSYIPRGGQ